MEREGVYDCDRTLHTVPYQDIRSETYFKTSPVSQFDTVLLSTVLHHEADSNLILSSAAKLSRLRIIVLENCIEDDYPEDYQQFVDLFFNECLNHTKLESPMSHRSVQEWEKTLSKYGELIAVEKRTDVPGIPLSHHMFVIEVKNSNGNV